MAIRKTHEWYVNEVNSIAGDTYEFLTKYVKSNIPVTTKHKECGYTWNVRPNTILSGLRKGILVCPLCNHKIPYTTATFKERVFQLVGYEYEVLEEYVHSESKIKMNHVNCGNVYYVKPNNFINGNRCPECYKKSRDDKMSKTHSTFAKEVYDLYGQEYMVLGEYVNCSTKINIFHNTCQNSYLVTPTEFLRGQRCSHCYGTKKGTTESFKQEVYNLVKNEYVVLGEYVNIDTKIKLHHIKCGNDYFVTPYGFIKSGNRCIICSGLKKKTTEEFKKEVFELEGESYTVLSEYVNGKTHILMEHKTCGNKWGITRKNFLKGHRCPKCKLSKGEMAISNWLNENNIVYKSQYTFEDCKYENHLRFDFAIFIEYRLISLIEFDGQQHFEPVDVFGGEKGFKLTQIRDNIKNEYCKSNNIPILRIPYWEKKNINFILESYIKEISEELVSFIFNKKF